LNCPGVPPPPFRNLYISVPLQSESWRGDEALEMFLRLHQALNDSVASYIPPVPARPTQATAPSLTDI